MIHSSPKHRENFAYKKKKKSCSLSLSNNQVVARNTHFPQEELLKVKDGSLVEELESKALAGEQLAACMLEPLWAENVKVATEFVLREESND